MSKVFVKKEWLNNMFAVAVVFAVLASPAGAGSHVDTEAAKGKPAYQQLCAQCHGPNMVNAGNSSFDLRKFPVDQFDRFKKSVTDGTGDMPAWGDMLLPGELESLWAYVRSGGRN